MLEICLGNKGKVVSMSGGMCGDIYILDQGQDVVPRFLCAKIPRQIAGLTHSEIAKRFVKELEKQLQFYHHMFVHWAFEFTDVMGAPVALFRYWGNDLDKIIDGGFASDIEKLSIIVYVCAGLRHCYKKGLISHQDLKPANIFLRDIKSLTPGLPDLDIYTFALVGDFDLADAFKESHVFDGSRPYMAPEQWLKTELSPKTDVFALGVILFELMSNGYHPVGIKLRDFWPQPLNGNSKKWTRPESWKKWAEGHHKISESVPVDIDPKILELIRSMLSISPLDRPGIDDVLACLLSVIKKRCSESHKQIYFLLHYFENQVSDQPLREQWPYLFYSWKKFESRFGKEG